MGNFFSGLGREARIDPISRKITIVMAGLRGHAPLYHFQVSTKPVGGEVPVPIDIFHFNNYNSRVNVLSPPASLLALEDEPMRRGNGIDDLASTHGADERFEVDRFNFLGLEGILNAMVHRSNQLHKDSSHGGTQRHFYPYIAYHPSTDSPLLSGLSTLSGRLLSSWEIAPDVMEEMMVMADYYREKKRCMYCDTVKAELSNNSGKSRIVFDDGNAVAIASYAPADAMPRIQIIPKHHTADFMHLSPVDVAGIMPAVYHSMMGLEGLSMEQGRVVEILNAAFHSASLHKSRDEPFRNSGTISDFFHAHSEIGTARIPRGNDPYQIPFSGYTVAIISPEHNARKMRR